MPASREGSRRGSRDMDHGCRLPKEWTNSRSIRKYSMGLALSLNAANDDYLPI
jgi:hypothetical protein